MKPDITKAQQARANAALEMMVRCNGSSKLVSRRDLIDRLVSEGYRVALRNGERVLKSPDGSWFDARNITEAGLDYAECAALGEVD